MFTNAKDCVPFAVAVERAFVEHEVVAVLIALAVGVRCAARVAAAAGAGSDAIAIGARRLALLDLSVPAAVTHPSAHETVEVLALLVASVTSGVPGALWSRVAIGLGECVEAPFAAISSPHAKVSALGRRTAL